MLNRRQPTILVVDDELTVREVVRKYLERDGFRVIEAENGRDALDIIHAEPPDLVVLDLMLPEVDGFAVMSSIRRKNDRNPIPVIMLTARTDETNRIIGFELGADDYVVKPFSPRELIMRIRAVLRRIAPETVEDESPLDFDMFRIDPGSRELFVKNRSVPLTAKEFELLWFLARHPAQVFSRAQLLDNVWGDEYFGDDSTVTVHICRLREKIEPDASKPDFIKTVWGVGYKFEGEAV